MATFAKDKLSGSNDGLGILLSNTASPGNTIHTGPSNASQYHEVWLYCQNYDTTARKLTVQWGNTTAGTDDIELTVSPESGLVLVVPGLILQGNTSAARVVRAFSNTSTSLVIHGYVHTIT
jgi:hypothetical protein